MAHSGRESAASQATPGGSKFSPTLWRLFVIAVAILPCGIETKWQQTNYPDKCTYIFCGCNEYCGGDDATMINDDNHIPVHARRRRTPRVHFTTRVNRNGKMESVSTEAKNASSKEDSTGKFAFAVNGRSSEKEHLKLIRWNKDKLVHPLPESVVLQRMLRMSMMCLAVFFLCVLVSGSNGGNDIDVILCYLRQKMII